MISYLGELLLSIVSNELSYWILLFIIEKRAITLAFEGYRQQNEKIVR